MDFSEVFEIQDAINQGAFGDSFRCSRKDTNQEFAVKVVTFTNEEERLCVNMEAAIWRRLKHKNVVNFHRVFKSLNKYYLIMELVDGENLFDRIISMSTYTEHDACHYMKQIFEALDYCHSKRIIHRDIKPENLLVCKNGRLSTLKITSFGLALRLRKGIDKTDCEPNGSLLYAAPEVLQRMPVGFEIDMWSCGVILFTLLGGYPPFWSEKEEKLITLVIRDNYSFVLPYWENVSETVKDLIMGLLQKDPKKRITASIAIKHEWSYALDGATRIHRYNTLEELRAFKARNKLGGAIFTVQARNRLQLQNSSQRTFTSVLTLNLKRRDSKPQDNSMRLLDVNENEV